MGTRKSDKTRKKCFKYFLENADKNELEYFNNFINSQIQNNININYGKIVMNGQKIDNKLEEFTKLLEFAPANFLEKAINKLKVCKDISVDF